MSSDPLIEYINALVDAFLEPVYDDAEHPAVEVIRKGLDENPELMKEVIREFFTFEPEVLTILTQLPFEEWMAELIQRGLDGDEHFRFVAVEAIENWGVKAEMLEGKSDPVPWLDQYMANVREKLLGK